MSEKAIEQQFLEAIERSKAPLIVLSAFPHIDDIVTAYSIAALLSKLQKTTTIVSSGGTAPKELAFLKATDTIKGDLQQLKKLTINVRSAHAKIDNLSYTINGDTLSIQLEPKTGMWLKEDIEVVTDAYKYDLIITIGVQDLEQVGELFQQYQDFFFDVPIINLDHKTDNGHYGQINLVDINHVSSSELCFTTFKRIDESLLDERIATYLLTGMIAKTRSFKGPQVTPKTLKSAGELMARGARRDEIVEHLYKTRSVETLRLWGRALARLKSDSVRGIAWTLLTRQDFTAAGASEEALESIVDELITTSPDAKISVVLYESKTGDTHGLLYANRPYDAIALGAPFNAYGTRESVHIRLRDVELLHAEKRVIDHLKTTIDQLTA